MGEIDLLLVLVPLEHREIDDPGQFEPVLVDEVHVFADLETRRAGEFGELFRIARRERTPHRLLEAKLEAQGLGALRADVFGDRTGCLSLSMASRQKI